MNAPGVQQFLRTKLVATIGPASAAPDKLAPLLAAGVDVCRLNFSHGTIDEHERVLKFIRTWSEESGRIVTVLGDLCGPKIRLTRVPGDGIDLQTGQRIRFERGESDCTPERLYCTLPQLMDEVQVGHRIYIDDGLVRLLVTDRNADAVHCTVTAGGRISSRKGINLPDTRLSVPALTEKDRGDLAWAVQRELDYVALSFVRKPSDVRELRGLIGARAGPGIIVKIEKLEALEHLDELVSLSDGVMVARGDLGVEMDVWQVPLVQKAITNRCREAGRAVIIATQMLQSMVTAPVPTRAEVSDVANAILDGADAVMLSAETASGAHPLGAVEMMCRIAHTTEAFGARPPESTSVDAASPRVSAIAEAAVRAALHVDARLVAVWTASGETARLVAKHRLPMPVVGLTHDPRVARRLNLLFGVVPLVTAPNANPVELIRSLDAELLRRGRARADDLTVLVLSTRPEVSGETDTVMVHRVGRSP